MSSTELLTPKRATCSEQKFAQVLVPAFATSTLMAIPACPT